MADDSEEACLVNPKSPLNCGQMPYTDGAVPSIVAASRGQSFQQSTETATAAVTGAGGDGAGHHNITGHSSTHTAKPYDINDDIILSQFHADAIKQAGCGKFQFIATLIVGMGLYAISKHILILPDFLQPFHVAFFFTLFFDILYLYEMQFVGRRSGHVIQVYSIFYILPSAEVEYCILDEEKNWVSNITSLGIGCGSLFFSALASKNGRKKTLISCLAISSVFSVIAAFMPAYGPFMMVRFCAAIGIGGCMPAAASYLCEITPLSSRARAIAFLCTLGISGGIFAGACAMALIPLSGQQIVSENKHHFSAWHRYLLLISIIPIISTILLCWLPESPRFLLANGNEVEALATYQQIYKTNRSRGGYALTELELPPIRARRVSTPSSVFASILNNIYACSSTFVQLYNEKYSRTTYMLMATWFASVFVFHGLTIYISEYSKEVEVNYYNRLTVTKFNITYRNSIFQTSLDNTIFDQCHFENCTFRGPPNLMMFISHVLFHNSTFKYTEFTNVKTSRTEFRNCTLDDTNFIDTDVSSHNFLDCKINNTKIVRLNGSCDTDFDYNIWTSSVWKSNLGGLIPCILAILSVGEAIQRLGRAPVASCCFTAAIILCVVLGFVVKDEIVIWIGGCAQGFVLAGLTTLTLFIVETYTTVIRCTALGVFVCFSQIGALLGSALYIHLPVTSTKVAATISTILMTIPFISSMILKDPCLLV